MHEFKIDLGLYRNLKYSKALLLEFFEHEFDSLDKCAPYSLGRSPEFEVLYNGDSTFVLTQKYARYSNYIYNSHKKFEEGKNYLFIQYNYKLKEENTFLNSKDEKERTKFTIDYNIKIEEEYGNNLIVLNIKGDFLCFVYFLPLNAGDLQEFNRAFHLGISDVPVNNDLISGEDGTIIDLMTLKKDWNYLNYIAENWEKYVNEQILNN